MAIRITLLLDEEARDAARELAHTGSNPVRPCRAIGMRRSAFILRFVQGATACANAGLICSKSGNPRKDCVISGSKTKASA